MSQPIIERCNDMAGAPFRAWAEPQRTGGTIRLHYTRVLTSAPPLHALRMHAVWYLCRNPSRRRLFAAALVP